MKRVSLEQARKLKKLGFNIPVTSRYGVHLHHKGGETGKPFIDIDIDRKDYNNVDKDYQVMAFFSAPYIAEVLEWIREEKGVYSWIEKEFHFWPKILDYDKLDGVFDNTYYDTYEESESALLDKLLEIIKATI